MQFNHKTTFLIFFNGQNLNIATEGKLWEIVVGTKSKQIGDYFCINIILFITQLFALVEN